MYVDITYAHQPPMTRMYKNLLAAGYAMLCTHWYTIIKIVVLELLEDESECQNVRMGSLDSRGM